MRLPKSMTSQISKSQQFIQNRLFNANFSESFVYYQTISMHLRNELYRIISPAFKTRNTYLRWITTVMNGMGIFVSYQFHERGEYQM